MYKTLIVDDREIFIIELKRLNVWGETSGFTVADKANNGSQALDLLRKNRYDLVITDIRMPIVDGLQLLRIIKKENLCPCVVLISEHSEFNYAREGIVLGAFDYLVKPVTEASLLELLLRSEEYLKANYSTSRINLPSDKKFEWAYPSVDEKNIINYIKSKDISAIKLFKVTLENLYTALSDNIISADIIAKKLYHNIIIATYEEYPWLSNFIDMQYFEEVDYFHDSNANSFIEFYLRKLNYLIKSILKLQPETSDNNINDICKYILNNPEADLKLKIISEKFYMNNTYLSNSFANKTGIHFNDYITLIKMSRAEYLLKNSNLKTYEVGYQIGYRDINYFMKQFKKVFGKSPSEYRNTKYCDYQI
ncbi:response regulator transcription factor [Ruminiclostridium josui]|uniref:response regulator transcription factor n=1 Tax=Ruminiclostridium josui TaxID=1499 RepID=UPI0004672BA0|nr:response regulator [Ruminiclostridium josui]